MAKQDDNKSNKNKDYSNKNPKAKQTNEQLERKIEELSKKEANEVIRVEAIKESLELLIKLGMSLKKVSEDDKITFFEGISLIAPISKLSYIINNIDKIKKEHNNLNDRERDYIIQYFKKEFKLSDNHLEDLIETGLEAIILIDKFISKV